MQKLVVIKLKLYIYYLLFNNLKFIRKVFCNFFLYFSNLINFILNKIIKIFNYIFK